MKYDLAYLEISRKIEDSPRHLIGYKYCKSSVTNIPCCKGRIEPKTSAFAAEFCVCTVWSPSNLHIICKWLDLGVVVMKVTFSAQHTLVQSLTFCI